MPAITDTTNPETRSATPAKGGASAFKRKASTHHENSEDQRAAQASPIMHIV